MAAPILLSTADTVAVTDESCLNFHGEIVRHGRANVRIVARFLVGLFSNELSRDSCELTESKLKDEKAKFISLF